MSGKDRKWLRFRVASVLIFFLVLFAVLVYRAVQLQIIRGDQLRMKADRQQIVTVALPPERGLILDQNGQKLAATVLADSVYIDPKFVPEEEKDRVAEGLSSILSVKKTRIESMIDGPKRFYWVRRKIMPEQTRKIAELDLKGVYILQEPKRFYPHRELAAHVLGFVDIDSEGRGGVERAYNECLLGPARSLSWKRDAKGKRIYLNDTMMDGPETDTCNLILTIDSKIQYITELQLREAVDTNRAQGGTAIVMDPRTGEILAMANSPRFNPNAVAQSTYDMRRNRAISDCFDPGSVFKPFVAAAALEDGVVGETDLFDCENGAYRIGRRVIHEAQMKKHEELTLPEILKYSSNIGIAKVAERVGKERLYHYITQFGFGSKTGIELPIEIRGIVRKPKYWRSIDFANTAFGQGISVTALQLASAMSAIANDGVLMQPHIVRGLVDQNGRVLKEYAPQVVRRVVSPMTAQRMKAMLTNVVEGKGGTGRRARVDGVHIAGKTGTSQKFDKAAARYSSRKVMASFIGFFPADNPQVLILVVLDEPAINRWGGVAAAPVFRNISEKIMRCSDRDIEINRVVAEQEGPGADILRIASGDAVSDAGKWDGVGMPDFSGMSVRDVLRLSRTMGVEVKIAGSGWAVRQNPAAGTALDGLTVCAVSFYGGF